MVRADDDWENVDDWQHQRPACSSFRGTETIRVHHYLRRRFATEVIVTLGVTLSRCVCVRRINLSGEGNALYPVVSSYLRRRLASREGIVTLAVTLCVCPPSRLYHVSTARRISLGGEGNALYPVLSSLVIVVIVLCVCLHVCC